MNLVKRVVKSTKLHPDFISLKLEIEVGELTGKYPRVKGRDSLFRYLYRKEVVQMLSESLTKADYSEIFFREAEAERFLVLRLNDLFHLFED